MAPILVAYGRVLVTDGVLDTRLECWLRTVRSVRYYLEWGLPIVPVLVTSGRSLVTDGVLHPPLECWLH